MRKAAYYVADCFETGTLEWKRNRYTITELPENYQQILGSFEESISGKLAEGSVYNIIHEIRKFLKYLEKAGCLTIQDLSADILRAYVIQEALDCCISAWPLIYSLLQQSLPGASAEV